MELNCELCTNLPYDTTDKQGDDIFLVCFKCKDQLLTERNIGNVEDEGED